MAEGRVMQQQMDVNQLRGDTDSTKATADKLDNRLTDMQGKRAVILQDLREIYRLSVGQVSLRNVSYGGSSVTVAGSAPDVDAIFSYARDLRSSGRFSSVWISSITGGGRSFNFALKK